MHPAPLRVNRFGTRRRGRRARSSRSPPNGPSPDYSIAALFDVDPSLEFAFEIDAMSSGNDLIPTDIHDRLSGVFRWAVFTFSVTTDSTPAPGSYLNSAGSSTAGRGAEVMGYYLDESATIPVALWDDTRFEQGAKSFGLGNESQVELSAFDLAMPVIVAEEGQPISDPAFSVGDYVYLSLSSSAMNDPVVGLSPVIQELQTKVSTPLNGATVFRLHWSGTQWIDPTVVATHTTLGLDPAEDVDALAVHHDVPSPQTMIFSTVQDSGFPATEQLQIVSGSLSPVASANPAPLEAIVEGQPVSVMERTGMRWKDGSGKTIDSDPDAICVYDPGTHPGVQAGPYIGVPETNPHPIGPGREFELSIAKEIIDPGVTENTVLHASGMTGLAMGGQVAVSFRGLATSGTWSSFGVAYVAPTTDDYLQWTLPVFQDPGFAGQVYDFKVDFAASDATGQSSWVTSIRL